MAGSLGAYLTKPKSTPTGKVRSSNELEDEDNVMFFEAESPRISKPNSKEVPAPEGETQSLEIDTADAGGKTARQPERVNSILCDDATSSAVLVQSPSEASLTAPAHSRK